jgi:deoxyribose-phosphate aldolase
MTDVPSRAHPIAPALELAIRCLDLTSLEGSETQEQVRSLCEKAVRPAPNDPDVPSVAAVVLYPAMVLEAVERLKGTGVKVASVAGFPIADAPLDDRLEEIRGAVRSGADEIDIVLNRALFLSGRGAEAAEEITRAKEASGSALLKVILETGELGSVERITEASSLAMSAGAEFLKTSTGKVGEGATEAAAWAMMEEVRAFHMETDRAVGVKISGGVRQTEQALRYEELVEQTLGLDWLTPERFRIGASSLLDDLVEGLRRARSIG